ncbi:MAG: glutamine--fructose-6-phosphate aminotransferase, partial [Flavobacteriales bacterium]|nr:glutamine--fructose-6-phosphate aminotransferase [Flavobacteriales bacterium]
MCGIVGYVGSKDAYPIIIKGLKRLEYRGYDSAGVAIGSNSGIATLKQKGKVSDLEAYTSGKNTSGSIGIGHTRWATHWVPNQVNSHPHNSGDGKLSIIHNGIIENYASIKTALETKGHTFKSDTDTEVLIHLIEDIKNYENVSLFEAVRIALDEVVGAYAIVVMEEGITNEFIAARKGSPLVIGVGRDEYYIASDATPIIEYTNEVVYLEDGEIARVNSGESLEI